MVSAVVVDVPVVIVVVDLCRRRHLFINMYVPTLGSSAS